jgi:hypothetical protein
MLSGNNEQETTSMDVINRQEEFAKQGYVIYKGFFSQEEVKALWENIKADDIKENTFGWDQNKLKFHTNFLDRNKNMRDLVAQPKVIDLLTQIIGPNIWVRWDQAVSKDPGAGTMPWHQDNRYTQFKHIYYQFWIPLTKMTPENGGLWVNPGDYCSDQRVLPHKVVDGLVAYDGVPENPTFIDAEPGDIVVFSSFLLHCTPPNLTQQPRWSYIVECLSLEHFDPIIEAPYFVIARDGKPHVEYANFYKHRLNPVNFYKYWLFKLKNLWYRNLRPNVKKAFQEGIRTQPAKPAI